MKKLKNYSCEIYAFLLVVAFSSIILYYTVEDYIPTWLSSILSLLLVADVVALYFIVCELWRTKWKKKLVTSVQKLVAKLAKKFLTFFEKRNLRKGNKTKILSGKMTISFDLPVDILREQKPKKPPKWKQLQSDRERLGYLYKKLIETRIKHGILVYSSETPSEIKEKTDNEDFENKIYDLYIANRYKETVTADTDTLNDLRSELLK